MSAEAPAETPADLQPWLPQALLPDWSPRLQALVVSRQRTPFRWGEHDCCLFAADAVLAMTGDDPAADLRGTYATEAEALALLARLGGLAGLAQARAGAEIAPARAQRGDIGLIEHGEGEQRRELLAVCNGATWLVPGPRGVAAVTTVPTRAWRCAPCRKPQ